MPPPKTIKCNGKTFSSVRAFAAFYKKHEVPVAKRLREGQTPEEAVGLVKRKRKGHGRSVTIDGIEFRTIKDACEYTGDDPQVISSRIYKGASVEEAFAGEKKPRAKSSLAKEFTYKGVYYPTGTALAKAFDLDWRTVSRRLINNWTVAQAVGDEPPPPRNRDSDGKKRGHSWKNVRINASGDLEPAPDVNGFKLYVIQNNANKKEYVGITAGLLEGRLDQHKAAARRGETAILYRAMRKHGFDQFRITLIRNDAATFIELQQQEVDEIERRGTRRRGYNIALGGSLSTSKPVTIDGTRFSSRSAAAEHYGVDPSVFNIRISRLKWTPEEAAGLIEKDWKGKAKSLMLEGVRYESLKEAAEAYEKEYKTVHARISYGWTPEQAFDLAPPPETMEHRASPVRYKGKKYPSMQKLAEAMGVYQITITRRLEQGQSLHAAIQGAIAGKRLRKKRDKKR
jgi:hypothetical protein